MTDPQYNSAENYGRLFSDIICEIGDDGISEETMINMLAGFELAIVDCMTYHEEALKRLRTFHGMYMRGDFIRDQEEDLPDVK